MSSQKVNTFFDFFVKPCNFMSFNQNIRFLFFYVNQLIHTLSMWIMWKTLCITLFSGIFRVSHMWITFCISICTIHIFRQSLCILLIVYTF
jgi:ABC-type amino acid transport system permease subunit